MQLLRTSLMLLGMSHAREAKQLCRKLVNLFSTMSQISPHPSGPTNTPDMFNLITQLAHYLKILIRIALTGSIKLERDQNNPSAMTNSLARLNLLAMDGSDPTVKERGDYPDSELLSKPSITIDDEEQSLPLNGTDEEQLKRSIDALTRRPKGYIPSTQYIAYGYRSLAVSEDRLALLIDKARGNWRDNITRTARRGLHSSRVLCSVQGRY